MARRTSAIWQYFNEVNEDKVSNWVCVICKTIGSCKNTSNLWKHLEVNHKAIYDEIKARKQPAKKRRREDDESSRLLDNDERMGEDLPHNNDNPSVAAAANNAGPSGGRVGESIKASLGYRPSSLGPEFDSQVSAVAPTPGHVPPHIQFTRLSCLI
jgi:hypothetical protein